MRIEVWKRKVAHFAPADKRKYFLYFFLALSICFIIYQQYEIVDLQSRMMAQEAADYGTHIGSLYWHAEVTDERFKEMDKEIYRLQKHSAKHDWALAEKNW